MNSNSRDVSGIRVQNLTGSAMAKQMEPSYLQITSNFAQQYEKHEPLFGLMSLVTEEGLQCGKVWSGVLLTIPASQQYFVSERIYYLGNV